MIKKGLLILLASFLFASGAHAEYRAYLLELYDHILKRQWEAQTGFSPDKYVLTHGGGNRLSVFVKATWICPGDTSSPKPVCNMPASIKPRFKKGDWVKITLEKHATEGWIGEVELDYYQADVKSNVYGIRFGQKRKLYNRYFEFNLEKASAPKPPDKTSENTETPSPGQPAPTQ